MGDPSIATYGSKGNKVVDFDGNDQMFTTYSFSVQAERTQWRNNGYTAFGVSRYTGGKNNRVITSKGLNWIMGHDENLIGRYNFGGWVDQGFTSDTNLHLFEILHQGRLDSGDPTATVWNDGIEGSYRNGGKNGTNDWNFYPSMLSFGASNNLDRSSNCQVAEFIIFVGQLEESDRLKLEGYLAHKWEISLPGDHPWAYQAPVFGEAVSSGSTPVGVTSQTLSPIVINQVPGNQTDTSATLSGQLVNAGIGIIETSPFTPSDYSGLRLWLDASDADGDGVVGSSYASGESVSALADKSGQGNDGIQGSVSKQPALVDNALNGKALLRFDGVNDVLEFEREIPNLRTVFMVVNSNTGNNGFILGHESSYSFYPGTNTAWSALWTDQWDFPFKWKFP